MLSEDKIRKLQELALRGIGGEMTNARAILAKHGIDWKKPIVKSAVETTREFFGMNTLKKYKVEIKYKADLLLLATLGDKLNIKLNMTLTTDCYIEISCKPSEMEVIKRNFTDKIRRDVSTAMGNVLYSVL
jgi:hypothetical protein